MKCALMSTCAAALAAVALLLGAPAAASPAVEHGVEDFAFESFEADYFLDLDEASMTTMRVVETIVARFPDFDQNRGIIRAIPLYYGEVPLHVRMLSVTDENGDAVASERGDFGGFAEFALGTDAFVQGRTTYVLEYEVRNAIRTFEDSGTNEFYWDINGDGWAQSFDTVTARVHLSDRLAAALNGDAACYVGTYGETGLCELSRDAGGALFDVTLTDIQPFNTLSVAIGFTGGTVTQPQLARDSWIVQLAPLLLLALAGLVVLAAVVYRLVAWRDAPGRGTIIAEFEPPEASDMLIHAEVIRRSAHGLPALFVDFAVRGLVRIIDEEPGDARASDKSRFHLEFVTDEGATGRERAVLVTLFGNDMRPGERVNPGALSASIGASLYGLAASTSAFAVSHGYRAKPSGSPARLFLRTQAAVVIGFVPIWIWAIVNDVLNADVIWPTIGAIVLAVILPMVLTAPNLLTAAGAALRDHLLGMREYLTVAEEQRMRMLQSPEGALRVDITDRDAVVKLYERLLPYAVLWGVEDRWAETLRAQYPSGAPSRIDEARFSPTVLRSFGRAMTASVRPIASTSGSTSWSSSSGSSFSSGSSGGGFSGGGGGGGGGGGR